MSDSISRANAIRWVKTECNQYGKPTLDYDSGLKVIEHLKKMPSELPSAEAEWIPCSERLPSDDGRYLVCMAWEYDNMEVLRWADGWNCHRGYDGKISRESEIDGVDIIAWMPLPKPYREDGEA